MDGIYARWRVTSDFLILALPFEATAKLLPQLPPAEGAGRAGPADRDSHEHWPICSVHLWFDREITELEHAVLLDREIHWMYNQSRLQPGRERALSSNWWSAPSRSLCGAAARTAIAQASRELAEFFPGERSEAGKGRAGQGGARHLRRPARHRCCAASRSLAVAQLLSGRRLDGDRLALDDGKRGAIGHLAAEAALQQHGEPQTILEAGSEAAGLMHAICEQPEIVANSHSFQRASNCVRDSQLLARS